MPPLALMYSWIAWTWALPSPVSAVVKPVSSLVAVRSVPTKTTLIESWLTPGAGPAATPPVPPLPPMAPGIAASQPTKAMTTTAAAATARVAMEMSSFRKFTVPAFRRPDPPAPLR